MKLDEGGPPDKVEKAVDTLQKLFVSSSYHLCPRKSNLENERGEIKGG
jgi:hypothetical protein